MTPSYSPPVSSSKFLRPLGAVLSVRVGADMKESLARLADADGRSLSSLVQKLLREFLELETALLERDVRRRAPRKAHPVQPHEEHHVHTR